MSRSQAKEARDSISWYQARVAELEAELKECHDRGPEVAWLEAEVERMRIGWDADVDWANKLLAERDVARAKLAEAEERLVEEEQLSKRRLYRAMEAEEQQVNAESRSNDWERQWNDTMEMLAEVEKELHEVCASHEALRQSSLERLASIERAREQLLRDGYDPHDPVIRLLSGKTE